MSNENIDEIKNKDLSPAMVAKFTKPKKTWFIERIGDGKIMAMEEMEAWKTLTNKSNWVRHDFKIIGVSDGETYARVVREAKGKSQAILSEIQAIEVEANKYRKTEERFIFEELLDLKDEKVIKVKKIIADFDRQLEKLNNDYFALTRNVAQTAFEAELAVARTNKKVFPSNQDIHTPNSTEMERNKILREMGQL